MAITPQEARDRLESLFLGDVERVVSLIDAGLVIALAEDETPCCADVRLGAGDLRARVVSRRYEQAVSAAAEEFTDHWSVSVVPVPDDVGEIAYHLNFVELTQ